ncbi:efflux RND transporter periplasmic adaptor subunit [Nitrincola iocasae]|jgi:membrane fusion protein (multidrug efflux system)|uniref:Efflux RND transporter periplasmic adaptor subunit n=1 Tax=Nitrincola iocasae TaxID=2614693 RepID=A0A5J6LFD7_9GAMM|nr:efflux RND transporter periplasmic adaptor subunit [Nitrincola iocasae]QEW07052.1 efflux RND transporter periplasmic adaptor subunit [Nitrincola iocasae]
MQWFKSERLSAKGSTLLGMVLLLVLVGCQADDDVAQASSAPSAAPVRVVTVNLREVTLTEEYAARVQGSREIEVRARVAGVLEERLYVEGQVVEQGTPLFRIDPEIYEIELQRASAERANARAELNQTNREWQRISALYQQNAVSQRDRDNSMSARELAEARLALTEAGVAAAELNLSYTQVEAPLSGITGLESLPEGSLIERGTLLTQVTQQDPVHVRFSLPERDAAIQQAARRAMRGEPLNGTREARLQLPDGQIYALVGRIDFTDSSIDPRTGSVSARAVFPNPDGELVPGQFVRVRVDMQTLGSAFVIPPESVGQGPQGPQVFVIENGQAHSRIVELGPVTAEGQVILSGLQAGDLLVISGQVMLGDGAPVRVLDADSREGV